MLGARRMLHLSFDNGPLTFALAMVVGVLAQGIARHVRLPGIVLLLATGVALGPDGAGIVRPETMGHGLQAVVGFSVAIILFEGGLNLRIGVLRHQAVPIRRLVTVGAVITGALAAVVARVCMDWDWRLSILFGTLVIVTGPTVITPLVRRLRIQHNIATILEAEGIFIDAIGATIAVVALEIAIAPSGNALGEGALGILARIGIGGGVGLAVGVVLALALRWRYVVPAGLENVLVLASAVSAFELSNALVHESGITAAIAAGLVLGNARSHALEEIREFKEQLTALLIATLFVLLAADVRLADVGALGWRGVATVVALVVLVRPVNVFASTWRTNLTVREKLFLSWLAPRGIVAAAVASLFAIELGKIGIDGGVQMKALVFLVIAATVTVQGLTGGLVADLLGVRLRGRSGYLILGANPLARLVATVLDEAGEEVVLVDSSDEACHDAVEAGFDVVHGNALELAVLVGAGADQVAAAVGLTPNESINFLFAQRVLDDLTGPKVYVALESSMHGVTGEMVREHDASVLFGGERELIRWLDLAGRGRITRERWRLAFAREGGAPAMGDVPNHVLLPVALYRKGEVTLVTAVDRPRQGDEVEFAIEPTYLEAGHAWLEQAGWVRVPAATADAADAGEIA